MSQDWEGRHLTDWGKMPIEGESLRLFVPSALKKSCGSELTSVPVLTRGRMKDLLDHTAIETAKVVVLQGCYSGSAAPYPIPVNTTILTATLLAAIKMGIRRSLATPTCAPSKCCGLICSDLTIGRSCMKSSKKWSNQMRKPWKSLMTCVLYPAIFWTDHLIVSSLPLSAASPIRFVSIS
jgi:hypothetical protein